MAEFISAREEYYMQHLEENEALNSYFQELQKGLLTLFDGQFNLSTIIYASSIIPELKKIVSTTQHRLKAKITTLIKDEDKITIAHDIAAKLMIKRRTHLTGLKLKDIELSVINFEDLE